MRTMNNKKILLVDDDTDFLRKLVYTLEDHFLCLKALNDKECLQQLKEYPDIILLDVEIDSAIDGIDLIEKIKDILPSIPIIMLTKHSDYRIVKKAMLAGATDYIVKPPDINELINTINRALKEVELKERVQILKNEVKSIYGELVGNCTALKEVKNLINKAAELECTVLITGESGTGKGLAARLIHELSKRKTEPFISVNISSIEKEMFLSELFGHEKGAFTGAYSRKKGLFELAGNGTLFLDEIGELEPSIQVKLLEVLDEKKSKRIGGIKDIYLPARVIAATNQNLVGQIAKGRFRKDLFFRLKVFVIEMPPLRNMREDIPELFTYFISKKTNKKINITDDGLHILKNYHWPGNVRELRNVVEMALIHSDNIIETKDIQQYLLNEHQINASQNLHFFDVDFYKAKDKFTKDYLTYFLKKNNYNISKTAQETGLQRTYIYKLIKSLNMSLPKN